MKPACTAPNNIPTGAQSPVLGKCETQLELQLTEQLSLGLEETHKEINMQANEIRRAAYHDLRQILRTNEANQTCDLLQNAIRTELHIRDIINTSAQSGAFHVKLLEWDKKITLREKLAILAEAADREESAKNWEEKTRLGLLRKIEATIKRIEKKHGVRVIPDLDYDDTIAPWNITGTYNPEIHAPNKQHRIKNVPIDPCQRLGFDNTRNEDRDYKEYEDWWGRGFVISHRNSRGEGISYQVRCLDGGAWDRSTWHGNYGNLSEAIDHALQITQVPMRKAA
jgi:hypothetical protein